MDDQQQRMPMPLIILVIGLIIGVSIAFAMGIRGFASDPQSDGTTKAQAVNKAITQSEEADSSDAEEAEDDTTEATESADDAATDNDNGDASTAGEQNVADLLARAGTDGTFRLSGPVNLNLDYSVMPYSLPLNPAGPQATMVRWVDGLGYSPNQAAQGTVYVLGHAWSRAPLALNPVSEAVVDTVDWSSKDTFTGTDGGPVTRYYSSALIDSEIAMTNDQGYTQRWRVDSSFIIPKYDAIADPELMHQNEPGKIVVMACAVADDADLEYNVVLIGHLI